MDRKKLLREIHESVAFLINLSRLDIAYQCFAPDKTFQCVNHITGDLQSDRNILEESARISRGDIKPISKLKTESFDMLVIPGGFGIARNFSNFATHSERMEVDKDIEKVILEFFAAKKTIAASCIAPIILAKVLGTLGGRAGIDITLGKKGNDWPFAGSIEVASRFGNKVIDCDVDEICRDRFNNIVTTPAYMKATAKPHEIFDGIQKLIAQADKIIRK